MQGRQVAQVRVDIVAGCDVCIATWQDCVHVCNDSWRARGPLQRWGAVRAVCRLKLSARMRRSRPRRPERLSGPVHQLAQLVSGVA